jgi:hypothetical protein
MYVPPAARIIAAAITVPDLEPLEPLESLNRFSAPL